LKKILYLTNNFSFYNEIGAGPASRQVFHVKELAKSGYTVEVVAPYVDNLSRRMPEKYAHQKIVLEQYPGFNLYRTKAFANFGSGYLDRLRNALSVAFYSGIVGSRIKNPDVIFATSPTIFVALTGWIISKLKRLPFILEIRDLWTESLRSSGYLGFRLLGSLSKLIENKLYADAAHIIAVTPGILEAVCAQLNGNEQKVTLITNGIDLELLNRVDKAVDLPAVGLNKAKDEFICMYAGKHARYNGLDNVLAAADLLKSEKRIRFILIGDGYHKPCLKDLAQKKGLKNVTFLEPVAKEQIFAFLRAADLFLLPYSDQELWHLALPNKLFDYMAAGRPIVAAMPPGDTSQVLSRARCGIRTSPGTPSMLAEAIKFFAADPELCRKLGQNGQQYVSLNYSRGDLGRKFVQVFEAGLRGT